MSAGNNVSLYRWVIYITVHMTVSENLFSMPDKQVDSDPEFDLATGKSGREGENMGSVLTTFFCVVDFLLIFITG